MQPRAAMIAVSSRLRHGIYGWRVGRQCCTSSHRAHRCCPKEPGAEIVALFFLCRQSGRRDIGQPPIRNTRGSANCFSQRWAAVLMHPAPGIALASHWHCIGIASAHLSVRLHLRFLIRLYIRTNTHGKMQQVNCVACHEEVLHQVGQEIQTQRAPGILLR